MTTEHKPQREPDEPREWFYRVILKGRVLARSAEEAEERALDAVIDGEAEDDEVEVDLA